MSTTKYVLFGALGLAAVLLLTSDAAKDIRSDIEEQAKKMRKKLMKAGGNAADTLTDLRDLLTDEAEGMSADVRNRIESILDAASSSAGKLKKSMSSLS